MGLSTEKRISEQPRAVNISGAVSPITRETASSMPVKIPPNAAGSCTLIITRALLPPRANPAEEEEGKNGFHLDSKEPDWSKLLTVFNLGIRCSRPQLRDFIMGEVRYNSLMKTFPQEAEELFVATERNAKLRYEGYKKLSEM